MDSLVTIGQAKPADDIVHLKPAVDPGTLAHKQLLDGPFWQRIPAYRSVDEATFLDHQWQAKNSITNPAKLLAAVQDWCRRASSTTSPRASAARRCRCGCRRTCCR
jgi:hypothetical protein